MSFSLDRFGNVDDDCGDDNVGLEEAEADAAMSIALFVNASTRFS
jgi:hypothetical protein